MTTSVDDLQPETYPDTPALDGDRANAAVVVTLTPKVDQGAQAMPRHRDVITAQTKARERVRDLAEVYTHEREVNAMLDLVDDMFPSEADPKNIARTFLEPACGAGNFLVAILERKLAYVTTERYRSTTTFETAVLKALSSVYGIDIDPSNVEQSRIFLQAEVAHHANMQLNTVPTTPGFWPAAEAIVKTNVICADTLEDATSIQLVEYHWQRKAGMVVREWSFLDGSKRDAQMELFSAYDTAPRRDAVPLHYSLLADNPGPVLASYKGAR